MKTLKYYNDTLTSMVTERTGTPDPWLRCQIENAARTWMLCEKMFTDLIKSGFTSIEVGSMGQQKTVVNPLLTQYNQMQRTLTAQFESLGLNYNATPSKVSDAMPKGSGEKDPMAEFFKNIHQSPTAE